MISLSTCILLLATLLCCSAELLNPERAYKILMLLPASTRVHRNVFLVLAKALADRGHQIVLLTNHRQPSNYPNIEEIFHDVTAFYNYDAEMFEPGKSNQGIRSSSADELPNLAREIYKSPRVKELYEKRKEFDLIIINHVLNELVYPFLHEMPFVTLITYGPDTRYTASLLNPAHPALVNKYIREDEAASIFGRLGDGFSAAFPILHWRKWSVLPAVQREISGQFPDLPPLQELEQNYSLSLINSHLTQELFLPLQPNQFVVTCMHCRPARPLHWQLVSWIEGAGSAGVVYFRLGSTVRGIPAVYENLFLEAFSKMKQRFIWDYENELENGSANVIVIRRIPQQDVLGHPNVKVFITDGGELSIQEALYHEKPLLIIPFDTDQQENADFLEAKERGLSLKWDELTVNSLVNAINEVTYNAKYKDKVASISQSYHDHLESPRERAVYWTEYVIRHHGAPKLGSGVVDLSWLTLYPVLDVAAFFDFLLLSSTLFILTLLLLYCTMKRVFGTIGSAINNRKKKKSKFY